jgi:Flp pilus assembly protein TadG
MSVRKRQSRTKSFRKSIAWLKNSRGSVLISVAVAILALFAFAVLAIDGALLLTTRTQLHAAADAAALAGASGLMEGSETTATQRAIDYASYNTAVQETRTSVLITPEDVTFPETDVIRVQTHRTQATGDALRTYFHKVISPFTSADVTAVSAAKIFDICHTKCLKPWAIPDRWDDANGNGIFDDGEYYDPDGTGYKAPLDVGASIVLKVGSSQDAIKPGIFFPISYPPLNNEEGQKPLTGGAWYRQWISGCEPFLVGIGDELMLEPGNMTGPTRHGMDELIAQDPNAQWDPVNKTIINSAYGISPRIGLVPFFDPRLPPTTGRNSVVVSKIGAFFIESVNSSGEVRGFFIQITTQGRPCETTGGPSTSLVRGIILVE